MTPVSLPRSREEQLIVDGRVYRIFVAWPAEQPPADGFPLIVSLDANASFATVVEAVRMRSHRPDATGVGPAVVVGVGYPGDGPYERIRRTFDYTREGSAQPDGGDGRDAAAVGGASRFLSLLQTDVPAMVAASHPIDRGRQAIIGHSLAGYFVLETLASAPAAFQTYVAISPSVWWDQDGLTARIRDLAARRTPSDPRLKVMVTVGEYEQKLAPWQEGKPPVATVAERRRDRRMVDLARDISSEITRIPNVFVRFEEIAGQDHASVVPISVSEAVRLAFQ